MYSDTLDVLYFYNLQTRSYLGSIGNVKDGDNVESIFANNETIWVLITPFSGNSRTHAYNSSTRARDSSKDISLEEGFYRGGGAFIDNTMYIIKFTSGNTANTALAYNSSTRARDSSKDISLGSGLWLNGFASNNTIWFTKEENSLYNLNAYSQTTTPGATIPPLINIPKGNYENRNSDWAKSEFDAPEVQSDKDFKIAVEEQRPGTRQDQNLSFVASGSTFTTTNPFPGIIRITYNNLSTDTDTYQRYTIFVPFRRF